LALNVVPPAPKSKKNNTKKMTLIPKNGTQPPGHASPRKNDGMSLYQIKFVGFTCSTERDFSLICRNPYPQKL
jgi:hypothetical protein